MAIPEWRQRLWQSSHQEGECRIWDGAVNNEGYGVFTFTDEAGRRRSVGAHKAAFLAAGNTLLPRQVVRHVKCHRTLCIEPAHLAAGTQKQNIADRKEGGTWGRWGEPKMAKKRAQRDERLAALASGITGPEFAERFGVSVNAAYQWLRRWKQRSVNRADN